MTAPHHTNPTIEDDPCDRCGEPIGIKDGWAAVVGVGIVCARCEPITYEEAGR